MTLPNFLIIGAQKSASSFVQSCIREHPQAFMPRYESPHFEDPYYTLWPLSKLESLFQNVGNEVAIGIKRPDYLARPECPARISQHIPDAKLIAVLRNPVDRAVSAYFWYMQAGAIPIVNVNQGLKAIINGEYRGRFPKTVEILDYGFYAEHVVRYLKYFKREQMLILQHDQVWADPRPMLASIYQFIEIDQNFLPSSISERPKQSVYARARLQWLAIATKYLLFTHMQYSGKNGRRVASHARDSQLARLLYRMCLGIDRVILARFFENIRPELDSDVKLALHQLYDDSIDRLEQLLDMDLATWRQID